MHAGSPIEAEREQQVGGVGAAAEHRDHLRRNQPAGAPIGIPGHGDPSLRVVPTRHCGLSGGYAVEGSMPEVKVFGSA
jgi:hypothetical protein